MTNKIYSSAPLTNKCQKCRKYNTSAYYIYIRDIDISINFVPPISSLHAVSDH